MGGEHLRTREGPEPQQAHVTTEGPEVLAPLSLWATLTRGPDGLGGLGL
jgi:hypothetical protein